MAKGIYIGDSSNKARKVKNIYIGGADGKAHKVKKIYIGGADGKARLCWSGSVKGNIVFTMKGDSTHKADKVYYAKNLGVPQEITLPNVYSGAKEIKVACSKTRFVCVVSTVNETGYASIYYSDDCINWKSVNAMNTQSDSYINIRYFEETGCFVVNNRGSLFWSTDGANWGGFRQINSERTLTDVAYGNGTYLLTYHNHFPIICNTLDGDITEIRDQSKINFSCAVYGDGVFVAHKPTEGIYLLDLSTMKWTLVTDLTKTISSHQDISMTYGNGMFLCGSYSNGVFYSYDGINWSSYTPPLRIMKVSFDGEKFLGTSDTNYAYSYDGLNWTYVPQPNTLAYYSIAGN